MVNTFIRTLGGRVMKLSLFRPRAKILAREHRRMRGDLVEVRRLNGLTQADVAELMDVSQQAVNKLERYDSDPKLSTLRRYATAVGALIEHRVSRDVGQSVYLAVPSKWERVGQIPMDTSRPVVTVPQKAAFGHSAWVNAKRTDFALSA